MTRTEADKELGPLYRRIAREYSSELSSACPEVRLIMVGGSTSSNGLCRGEDLDFDIVVQDGQKYSTYLRSLYLGLKYSIRYRELTKERYFWTIPKLICINVIWEVSQVAPFTRKDEQLAYEVFNCEVLHGRDFYDGMIRANPWIIEIFPQIGVGHQGPSLPAGTASKGRSVRESMSRSVVFSLYRMVRLSRLFSPKRKERMDRAESVKYPYGMFDDPAGRNV
jgi:hypothetical protein